MSFKLISNITWKICNCIWPKLTSSKFSDSNFLNSLIFWLKSDDFFGLCYLAGAQFRPERGRRFTEYKIANVKRSAKLRIGNEPCSIARFICNSSILCSSIYCIHWYIAIPHYQLQEMDMQKMDEIVGNDCKSEVYC